MNNDFIQEVNTYKDEVMKAFDIDNFKDVKNDLLEFLSKPEQIMDDKEIKDYCLEHMNALFEQDLKII